MCVIKAYESILQYGLSKYIPERWEVRDLKKYYYSLPLCHIHEERH